MFYLLGTWPSLFGQSFEPRWMDVASMQEELVFVQDRLNQIHPEPYHFISRENFDEKVRGLRDGLAPMTVEQWYVSLAGLLASLHDGHTALIYDYGERQRYFNEGGKTLPFFVQVTDDRRVIIRHQFIGDSTLAAVHILNLNGLPMDDILHRMGALTFGESDVFRNSQVTRSFARMHWLLYGHCDSVSLTMQSRDGMTKTERFACITESQYNDFVKRDFPQALSSIDHHMHLTVAPDRRAALLSLVDFNTYKGYEDSIAQVFRTIREERIDTLFIDVRDNGGGQHYITEELNHYLLDTPWVLVSKAKIRFSDAFYEVFPGSVRWLARIMPKKPALKLAAATMTRNTKIARVVKSRDPASDKPVHELYTRPKRHHSKEYLYKGKVFLLADRNSYSMSGMFAAILKDYGRAVIVGEETGGLAKPHGSNVALTLPHSKFTLTVSTSRAYRPSGVFDDRGVLPDIQVPYSRLTRARTIEECLALVAGKE